MWLLSSRPLLFSRYYSQSVHLFVVNIVVCWQSSVHFRSPAYEIIMPGYRPFYVPFGTKMMNIVCGPLWKYEPTMQAPRERQVSLNPMNPQNVSTLCVYMQRCAHQCVYIAIISSNYFVQHKLLWMYLPLARGRYRDIEREISVGSEIQVYFWSASIYMYMWF